MEVKKEIVIKGKKAILSYNNNMFGKDANALKHAGYTDAKILFIDEDIRAVLLINGEEYYSDKKGGYVDDFYFEVVDMDKFDNELSCSDTIHVGIDNEKELIEMLSEHSEFVNNMRKFESCPKGFVKGHCDEEASNNCEYSAVTRDGLCGAECQNCEADIFASKIDEAYECECSKILFKDRHSNTK